MANFNAGAIEGTLTLDRSPFNKDLKEAMAEAKKFEAQKIRVPLEIDGLEKIDELKAKLNEVQDETVKIELEVDNADAIGELQARLDEIRDEVVTIELEIDGEDRIPLLEAELAAIPDETVTVEVDTDKAGSALKRLAGDRDSIQGTTVLVGALIAILPAIVPLALGAAAAVGALISATSILAAGVGALALVAIPAWKNYKKAVKEADGDMSKLSPQMRALKAEQDNLNNALKNFGSNNRIYAVIGGGMRLIATVLKQIKPLVDVVTIAVSQLITQLIMFAQSPGFKQVVAFLTANFIPIFKLVTGIVGDLIVTIAGITEAFAPFAQEFLGGLKNITAAWANWAKSLSSSNKFQDFLNYVRQTGPKIIELVMSISRALGNIGKALAPLGGPVLDAVNGFFNALGSMNPSVLGAIIVGVGTLTVAIIGATVAMAAFDAIAALNPFVLIAIAIIALVAAFIYLWKTNEGFRNFFISTWNAIWGFMKSVGAWFAGPFAGFFVGLWNGLMTGLQAIGNFFVSVWNGIKAAVQAAVNFVAAVISVGMQIFLAPIKLFIAVVTAIWGAFWKVFGGLITAAINLVKAIINLGFAVMASVISAFQYAILKTTQKVWGAISSAVSAVVNAIQKVVSKVWGAISSATSTAWNAVKNVTSKVWGALSGPVTSAVNAVKSVVSKTWDAVKSATSTAWNGLKDVISKAINAAKDAVSSVVDKIKGIFSGAAGWLISAGKNIIQGLIDGITSKINVVTDKLKELTSKIPKVKGPEEVDKKLLRPAGAWIMQGFNDELEKGIDQALSTLGGFTGQIPTTAEVDGQLALTPNASSRATQAGGGLSKEDFLAAISELIRQVQQGTQPLIGEYHANDKDPKEIAEEWWLMTKGRG